MRRQLIKRFERIQLNCSKCPIPQQDCEWMAATFQKPDKPQGKAKKWCPLIITVGNIMALLEPGATQSHLKSLRAEIKEKGLKELSSIEGDKP